MRVALKNTPASVIPRSTPTAPLEVATDGILTDLGPDTEWNYQGGHDAPPQAQQPQRRARRRGLTGCSIGAATTNAIGGACAMNRGANFRRAPCNRTTDTGRACRPTVRGVNPRIRQTIRRHPTPPFRRPTPRRLASRFSQAKPAH
jgi:hypothetical protein